MSAQRLIALGGVLRAGKDEVAKHLASEHGYVVMGMSDPLNEALQRIGPQGPWIHLDFDIIIERPWEHGIRRGKYHRGEFVRYGELLRAVGYVESKRHLDVREYLQGLGTEVGREMIDQDVWVDIATETIHNHWADGKSVVITAIRFPNELQMVRKLGGSLVWVERSVRLQNEEEGMGTPESGEKSLSEAHSAVLSHSSENSVFEEDFDYVLENDSSLEHLFQETDRFLSETNDIGGLLRDGYYADPVAKTLTISRR